MVLHITLTCQLIFAGLVCGSRALIAIQTLCHLCPWVQLEDLAQRECRFGNSLHGIQSRAIDLVLIRNGHRQFIVVVTDIDRISDGWFFCFGNSEGCHRRRDECGLTRRIIADIRILAGTIMEDGISSHGHEFLAFGVILLIHPNGVTDNTERDIPRTGIHRRLMPYLLRYIGVTYLSFSLAEPSPPSEEVGIANRQLHILLRIIVEDTFVLVNLLHSIFVQRIAGGAGVMDKHLVIGVLIQTGLRNGETEVLKSRLCFPFELNEISDIDIGGTRCTDTALGTLDGNGMVTLGADTTPRRFFTRFVNESYLRFVYIIEFHGVRYIFDIYVNDGYTRFIYIMDMVTDTSLRTENELMRNGIINRVGEDIVILIVLDETLERVEWLDMIDLTDQGYFEFGIANGFEAAPFVLEPVRRRFFIERQGHMQRIYYIDVLAAYRFTHRRGRSAGRRDDGSKGGGIEGMAQSAADGIPSIEGTCIGDIGNIIVRAPFQLIVNQVCDVVLVLAAAINDLIAHEHRVLLIGFIAGLDSDCHIGVIPEDHGVAAGVSTIIEKAILPLQIAPREDRRLFFGADQFELRSATAGDGKLQPCICTVLQFHLLLLIGVVVGKDIDVMEGEMRRVRGMHRSYGAHLVRRNLEIAFHAMFGLQRYLRKGRIRGIRAKMPRRDIFGIAIRRIERAFHQGGLTILVFIEYTIFVLELTEDESFGTCHDIIAFTAALHRPDEFISLEGHLRHGYACRDGIRDGIDDDIHRYDHRILDLGALIQI